MLSPLLLAVTKRLVWWYHTHKLAHITNVQTWSDGQYDCDSTCLQWASSHICSHTIAVAEYNKELALFLHWFVKYAESPNIIVLVMSGLPRGHGKKGGKPKRQHKRQLMPPADSQSLTWTAAYMVAISNAIYTYCIMVLGWLKKEERKKITILTFDCFRFATLK